MIPYAYQIKKQFVCVECGSLFESGSPQARYCTLKCQRTAKSKRRARRDAKLPHDEIVENRFFAQVENPTLAQLRTYGELVRDELTNDKPVRFYGIVPMWTPIDGIIFEKSEGVNPEEWVMFHPAMVS